MILKHMTLYILWLLIPGCLFAEVNSLVRIYTDHDTPSLYRKMQVMGADIAAADISLGYIDVILESEQQKAFSKEGYQMELLIPDINTYAAQLRAGNYLSHFHSNDEILAQMQQTAQQFPDIVALYDIGDSYLKTIGRKGFDIWAMKISDEAAMEDPSEAQVLFMANIHAREIITPGIILRLMQLLTDGYQRDPYLTHLVDHREIWLIPTLNPDGYEYVFTGNPENRDFNNRSNPDPLWWRKNMGDNDGDTVFNPRRDGVDINRNFGFKWGIDDFGSSPKISDDTFRGVSPFSEVETQIIRDFVGMHRFIISTSLHSYSNLWLYPWGYSTIDQVPTSDLNAFVALAERCVAYNGYTAEPGSALYLVNGCSDDWLYGEHGIFAFTSEVGDPFIDGFFPDTTRIEPLIHENVGPCLFLIYAAGEEPIVTCETVSDTLAPFNSQMVRAKIEKPIVLTGPVDLDSTAVTLSYRHYDNNEFTRTSMKYDPLKMEFAAEISGIGAMGKTIYYYVEASDSKGRFGTSPIGAPAAVDSFFVQGIDRVEDDIKPASVELTNFPNPFNQQTTIRFALEKSSTIRLDIYNIRGQHVRNLATQVYPLGTFSQKWDGRDDSGYWLDSGVYYCRLVSDDEVRVQKLLIIK